ncbi:MAG: hypothetical protein WA061_02830 [Microgenomates group bacterium]
MEKLIIEFPSKEMMEYFIGQMSDGFGENFCGFSTSKKKEGTTGKKMEDYEKIVDTDGNPVCFVDFVEGFNE